MVLTPARTIRLWPEPPGSEHLVGEAANLVTEVPFTDPGDDQPARHHLVEQRLRLALGVAK
jgi:hypothetical protein